MRKSSIFKAVIIFSFFHFPIFSFLQSFNKRYCLSKYGSSGSFRPDEAHNERLKSVALFQVKVNERNSERSESGRRIKFELLKDATESAFLNFLNLRAKESSEMTQSEKNDLYILLQIQLGRMKHDTFPYLVGSIGNLKLQSKNWDSTNVLKLLLDQMQKNSYLDSLSVKDTVMLITGFARLQAKFSILQQKNQNLINKLIEIIPKVDVSDSGDILWSFGLLSVNWNGLSKPLKDSIMVSLSNNVHLYNQ